MPRIKRLETLEKLLAEIPDQASFFVLAEDWQEGLAEQPAVTGSKLRAMMKDLQKKYEDNFVIRAFNDEMDFHWNGETGLLAIAAEAEEEPVKLSLISQLPKLKTQYPAAGRLNSTTIHGMRSKAGLAGEYIRFVGLGKGHGREG